MRELAQIRTLCCSNSSIFLALLSLFLISSSCTTSPEKRPSPLRSDSIKIGTNLIRIEYSSPGVKGRKIFGSGEEYLEQYGEIWRTGANEATVFSTQQDIRIDTFYLPQGKYALFTIPNHEFWEVILNKDWNQWGAHNHQESLDVVRFQVVPRRLDSVQEQMTFSLTNSELNFMWENTGWSLPISLNE